MMEHESEQLGEHTLIDRLKSPHSGVTEIPASPGNSKDDDSSSGKSSPDSACAICLGRLENKSFTDSCFHIFCFTCLVEWSKVKAECPLCKQPFKSIVHNVRSIEDYDQYYINARAPESSWQSPDGRRFRYPSTLTAERRRHRAFEETLEYRSHRLTYAPHTFSSNYTRDVTTEHPSTSNFRRHIYENALWVQQGDEPCRRYRDTSPEFFCQNPACTHRLIPWLNRELLALLHDSESQVIFVLELILALIMRYDIKSPEFYVHIEPYLQNQTPHFIHEFYNYARSPYDMSNYDRRAVYECLETRTNNENHSSVSSTTSDVIILPSQNNIENLLQPSTDQLESSSKCRSQTEFPSSQSTSQTNTVTDTKQLFWHSDESWMHKESSNSVILSSPGATPQQDLESGLPGTSSSVRRSIKEGRTSITENKENISDNDSDCVVVGYIKPRSERTPELIDLVSNSSDTEDYYENSNIQKSYFDKIDDKNSLKKRVKTFLESECYNCQSSRTLVNRYRRIRYPSWSPTGSSSSNSKHSEKKEKKFKNHKRRRKSRRIAAYNVSSVDSGMSDSDGASTDYSEGSSVRLCSVIGKTSTMKFYRVTSENSSHKKKHKKQKKKHRKHKHHRKHRHHSSSSDHS